MATAPAAAALTNTARREAEDEVADLVVFRGPR